ncbi:hypothetical protein SNEBB_003175 [Seison nebaliae]|nr:hypothetical protein SNEBB_003175 [Seison nebaliae]
MTSFIDIPSQSDFTFNNLPYGVVSVKKSDVKQIGVAIGEQVLLLQKVLQLYKGPYAEVIETLQSSTLNDFMGTVPEVWKDVRRWIIELLLKDSILDRSTDLKNSAFAAQKDCVMHLPFSVGDYTDFYSSKEHATNVGIMFRGKDNALMPNWKWIPVGYHGRASSVVVSGTDITRPKGMIQQQTEEPPIYEKSKLMDFEMEMAFVVGGPSTKLGESIEIGDCEKHIFGMVLMNDWSARDIQKYEYVPLGPFLGKNFGTTISPWVVTMLALEPFKVDNVPQEPLPRKHLQEIGNYSFDIKLSVDIQPRQSEKLTRISDTNFRYMYWTMRQQLAHHTANGCNVKAGDLMGSGTISGKEESSYGSMLELSWRGSKSIKMNDGTERKFLQDGDTVLMRGHCQNDDGQRLGFGDCSGKLLPST